MARPVRSPQDPHVIYMDEDYLTKRPMVICTCGWESKGSKGGTASVIKLGNKAKGHETQTGHKRRNIDELMADNPEPPKE